MGNRLRLTGAVTLLLVILLAGQSWAGVTGKISGLVKDTQNGQPIVGATVRVVGTDYATTTDEDGEYFIINLPSGKYDLAVSNVGFETMLKKEVRVLIDLTTPVDFELRQMAVELKQQMVVYATAPEVQKDLTSSKVIYTADRLKNMPNITTVQAVLTNYPGVVMDKSDAMHVRGGRSGQVSYYYDGFSIQDPFLSTAGMRIMPSALEELSLTSGGFTAEYGEALSGVVSAVTPEGGSVYHGHVRTYGGATHAYDVNTGKWGALHNVGNRSLSMNLSGPLPFANPEHYTFFAAGEYYRDPTSLPHNTTTSYSASGKVAMLPSVRLKLVANGAYYISSGELYTHRDVNGRSYDFNLDGLPLVKRRAYLGGLSGQYSFSERAFVNASFSHFYTRTKQAPGFLWNTYWRDWPGYSEDSNGVYNGTVQDHNYLNDPDWTNPYEAVGFTQGPDFNPTYAFRESGYNSFTASYLNQVTKAHQLKIGGEYRRYDIFWDKKQFYNQNPYGELYSSKPTYAALYAQDKLEYADFIVNMGLRWDYRNADVSYNVTPDSTAATYQRAQSKTRWSPRLGVSFPISETSVMHFNYGLYYQEPQFSYLYTNLQGDRQTGLPLLGNPDLAPEQTVSYELGLDHMIGSDLRFDLTAYYKDISDLVTTRTSGKIAGQSLTAFDNGDIGSVTGFDVAIDRLAHGGNFSASIAYSYMIATGTGSYALEPYYTFLTSTTDTLAPVKEYPLDFDQRHTLTATMDYRVPKDWKGSLFGLGLPGAWGVALVGYVGSGLPYTKTDAFGNRLGERNEGRLPSNYSVDMRFNKDFAVGGPHSSLTFFVEIDNLFNKRNILNVYSRSGLADNDYQRPGAGLSLNQDQVNQLDALYDHDPQNFPFPGQSEPG